MEDFFQPAFPWIGFRMFKGLHSGLCILITGLHSYVLWLQIPEPSSCIQLRPVVTTATGCPLCVPTRTAWLTCPIDLKLIKSCHKRPTKIIEVSFKLVVVYVAWRFLWSFLSYKLVVRQDDNFDRTLRGFLTVLLWWRRPKQRSQPVKTAPETPSFFERGWGAGSQRAQEPPPGWFQQTSPATSEASDAATTWSQISAILEAEKHRKDAGLN